MSLFSDLEATNKSKRVYTENGALMEGTSGKALLDLNFNASTLNYEDPQKMYDTFYKVLLDTPRYAMRWLAYARDARGGMGHRNIWRNISVQLMEEHPAFIQAIVNVTPEYGYWKDLVKMYGMTKDEKIHMTILNKYKTQLMTDLSHMVNNEPITLAGKYAPTDTSKDAKTAQMANDLMKVMGMNRKEYRTMNRELRSYSKIIEKKMSENHWSDINYENVPSKANKIYRKAFKKHDGKRYDNYLNAVEKGEAKMNSGQLYPHEILKSMQAYDSYDDKVYVYDKALEAMWKEYPRTNLGKIMVVEDRSGSMWHTIKDNLDIIDVADALTLLFAEQLDGEFKNSFITFSERPKIWHIAGGTLAERANYLQEYSEVRSTNIEAVFDLLLNTAVNNGYTQEELPETLLIISDMEFNRATHIYGKEPINATLFETITTRYEKAGYHLPRLVFWNLNGRTRGIPVSQNKEGVALISGYSPAILERVLSGGMDAWQNLKDVLDNPRYDLIEKELIETNKKQD